MTGTQYVQYELTYVVDSNWTGHESWLLEWSLDWNECPEVTNIAVARQPIEAGILVLLCIEWKVTDHEEINLEWHQYLLEQLTTTVDDIDIAYYPIDEPRDGTCRSEYYFRELREE